MSYRGAAERVDGSASSDDFFPLHPENVAPTGATTDGARLWISDDSADCVFVYDAQTGLFLGRWTLDAQNVDPAEIARDPTGASDSLWFVDPNETTAFTNVAFYNTNRATYTYDLVYVCAANNPPTFASVPVVDVYLATEYRYDALASDPDGDSLTYALLAAPKGTTSKKYAGEIVWTPTADQLGKHTIVVQADDGRGGIATQTFTLNATNLPPNRPPMITSVPVAAALNQYGFRPEAVTIVVLVADEDRSTTDRNITYQTVLDGVNSKNAVLQDENSQRARRHDEIRSKFGLLVRKRRKREFFRPFEQLRHCERLYGRAIRGAVVNGRRRRTPILP